MKIRNDQVIGLIILQTKNASLRRQKSPKLGEHKIVIGIMVSSSNLKWNEQA